MNATFFDSEQRSQRRNDLLAIARRSREKWILEAADKSSKELQSNKKVVASVETSSRSPSIRQKVPVVGCIQGVFDLLSNIVDDGETVDVDTMAASCLFDDNDDLPAPLNKPLLSSTDSFSMFLEKLRSSGATEIVKSMQKFVLKFEKSVREARLCWSNGDDVDPADVVERTESIWKFHEHICQIMRENVLWADESATEWSASVDSCEKLLFVKLYKIIFATDPNDAEQDTRMTQRIQSLAFLTPEHLDVHSLVGSLGSTILKKPSEILLQLQHAHCPADKLAVIKNCSLAIAEGLKEARKSKDKGRDSAVPGADEFLPMMILVLKDSNPPQLKSTIKFLQRYTRASRLVSESGYLLTHFVSTVHFLENVDAQALTIAPEEFERCLTQCTDAANQALAKARNREKRLKRLKQHSAGELSGWDSATQRLDFPTDLGLSHKDQLVWRYFGSSQRERSTSEADVDGAAPQSLAANSVEVGVEGGDERRAKLEEIGKKYDQILTTLTKFEESLKKASGRRKKSTEKYLRSGGLSTSHSLSRGVVGNGSGSGEVNRMKCLLTPRQQRRILDAAATFRSLNSRRFNSVGSSPGVSSMLLSTSSTVGTFYDLPPETISFGGVWNLVQEYRLLVEACAILTADSQ